MHFGSDAAASVSCVLGGGVDKRTGLQCYWLALFYYLLKMKFLIATLLFVGVYNFIVNYKIFLIP